MSGAESSSAESLLALGLEPFGEKAFGVDGAGFVLGDWCGTIDAGIGIGMPEDDAAGGRTEPMRAAGAIICGDGCIAGLGFVTYAGGAFDFVACGAEDEAIGRGPGG